MGKVPEFYLHIKAARYLGCNPWDLLDQPLVWRDWALDCIAAENAAANQKHGPKKKMI
jgi:hypothetical protein